MPNVINRASIEYEKRQSRREHPSGSFDRAGRWYASDEERASCCNVRGPSRAFPYSQMVHCRTLKHIKTRMTEKEGGFLEVNNG